MDNTVNLKEYNFRFKILYSKNIDYKKSACWYCVHHFDNDPIHTVMNYNQITKSFNLYGVFCSWECCFSYSRQYNYNLPLLKYYKKLCTGEKMSSGTTYAKPRECLKLFGGKEDIKEFRKNTFCHKLFIPPNTLIVPSVVKYEKCEIVNENIIDPIINISTEEDIKHKKEKYISNKKTRRKRYKEIKEISLLN